MKFRRWFSSKGVKFHALTQTGYFAGIRALHSLRSHALSLQRLAYVITLFFAFSVSINALQAQDEFTCETIAPQEADATFYLGLGDAYNAQGDFARAIVAYSCGIDLNPDYAPPYISRGLAHAAQFNQTAALADYDRAIELDDSLVSAYNNRGVLYSQQANYALAIADFTLVTALAPEDASAYHNRGLVHAAEGNYDLAIADLEQAIALDANFAAPHSALGAVYLALALQSYRDYEAVAGRPAAPIPADMLATLDEGLDIGDSSAWLALQTPSG
jgi:tetratricopeptide (TPR) repeat protein